MTDELMKNESEGRGAIVLLIGAVAALLLIGAVYLVGYYSPAPAKVAVKPLPMGPAEQAYAQHIQFLDPKLARAANFLNQEVTFVFGTVSNDGPRAVQQIEVTLEFHDQFKQVVLRDTQRLFSTTAEPLPPNGSRDFQLSYETMPAQWNQTYPTMRITGLDLR
ncbi:MAG TPA: DUF2393 family protein [Candidatus Acidoferrales bacterium]|jgi:xanthosine utilization system XapX-like protein